MNAHERAPETLRTLFKNYQGVSQTTLQLDKNVFDIDAGHLVGFISSSRGFDVLKLPNDLNNLFRDFLQTDDLPDHVTSTKTNHEVRIYEHPDLPGLYILPSLLPPSVQTSLLNRLLHRDISNPQHKSNLTLHYKTPSFHDSVSLFSLSPTSIPYEPLDPNMHPPLSVSSVLNKKLRWITLGGQYDWTEKRYPSSSSPSSDPTPPFPDDITSLVTGLFPTMLPEAGILNLYSPGDTLSLHRDVAEFCNRPLVSISLGCEGVFIAGLSSDERVDGKQSTRAAVMKLKSGDVLVMSDEARYAWHGVPTVLANTCPEEVMAWPCKGVSSDDRVDDGIQDEYEYWRGWLKRKRINLNIRQMFE